MVSGMPINLGACIHADYSKATKKIWPCGFRHQHLGLCQTAILFTSFDAVVLA